jgi:hypothetical protein
MTRAAIFLVLAICALSALARIPGHSNLPEQQRETVRMRSTGQEPIKVSIETVVPLLGSPIDHYQVGEQIPVTIALTNTLSQPAYACVSSDLYQDLPRLSKNGQVLPYAKSQTDLLRNYQEERTCQSYDLPEQMLLKSNEPTVVDFLIIADDRERPTGAQSWYDTLAPGSYELSIQRRFDCCDGPMVESNKIRFEVMP